MAKRKAGPHGGGFSRQLDAVIHWAAQRMQELGFDPDVPMDPRIGKVPIDDDVTPKMLSAWKLQNAYLNAMRLKGKLRSTTEDIHRALADAYSLGQDAIWLEFGEYAMGGLKLDQSRLEGKARQQGNGRERAKLRMGAMLRWVEINKDAAGRFDEDDMFASVSNELKKHPKFKNGGATIRTLQDQWSARNRKTKA